MNLKVFTSKFVGTGPSSYEKIIYWAAVSQRMRNTGIELITAYVIELIAETQGEPQANSSWLPVLLIIIKNYIRLSST